MTDVENRATGTNRQPEQDAGDNQQVEGTQLNHVEFLHRPGEAPLVIQLFESLNCRCEVIDSPPFGKYIVVRMSDQYGQNDFFASEAEEEQLALENALQRYIDAGDSDLALGFAKYRELLDQRPYRATHIGIRLPSVAVYDEVIQRLESLSAGKLAGRLTLGFSMRHTAEEALSGIPVKQVWIWTDLMSTGLLSTGQQIEIQTYTA
jgi:hypothetical protein